MGILGVRVLAAGAFAALALTAQPTARAAQETFEITGEVDGLYPGAEATLDARVTNPQPFVIRVTSLAVTVRDASPECPASMLEIDGSTAGVDVPAGGTAAVPLAVRMAFHAPDACQGATWPLEFVGTAVQAGGGPTEREPSPGGGGGSFAVTGAEIAVLVALAVLALAAGIIALSVSRRQAS